MALLHILAGSILLCIGSADNVEHIDGHSRHSYPNPMNLYSLCGRQQQSYVCDPDNVISVSEGLLVFDDIRLSLCCTNAHCFQWFITSICILLPM